MRWSELFSLFLQRLESSKSFRDAAKKQLREIEEGLDGGGSSESDGDDDDDDGGDGDDDAKRSRQQVKQYEKAEKLVTVTTISAIDFEGIHIRRETKRGREREKIALI